MATDVPSVVPRFRLGELIVDADAHDVLDMNRQSLAALVKRHATGDWGDVTQELQERNEKAIAEGHWIKSLYWLDDRAEVIGIRTNASRTETHVRVEWDAPQGLLR